MSRLAGSAPPELAQLVQGSASERHVSIHTNLEAASYVSLLQSSCKRIAIAFSETHAAGAAAVATAVALKASAQPGSEAAATSSMFGPNVSFVSDREIQITSTSRLFFMTTEVLSFHLLSTRAECEYDSILLCNIEQSDCYCALILKAAGDRAMHVPVVHVHAVTDGIHRQAVIKKVLDAEVVGDDLLSCVLERHKEVAELRGNTVVFMLDDDITKFISEHKRELSKHFVFVQLRPQATSSQLLNLVETCQAGGVLIFVSAICARSCFMIPNIHLAIDSCVSAQKRCIDGVASIIPVVPSSTEYASNYEAILSESSDRASCANIYIRVCEFETQIWMCCHAMRLYNGIIESELARAASIGRDLAGTIAAILLECETSVAFSCVQGAVSADFQGPAAIPAATCIKAALIAIASLSSDTYSSETAHRQHMRRIAFAALACAGKIQTIEGEKGEHLKDLVQTFQFHLSTLSPFAFRTMQRVIPYGSPDDCLDAAQQKQDDSYALRALAHGFQVSDLNASPRFASALARLQNLSAVDEGSITEKGSFLSRVPLSPELAALVFRCSQLNMPAEGMIAAAVILTNGPFWKPEACRSTDDSALKTAVAAVVDAMVKEYNAISENSAMTFAQLGRVILRFAPQFKETVKSELRKEPGVVFVGQRADQRVYFDECFAASPHSASVSPHSKQTSLNTCDFFACIAVVASCMHRIKPDDSEKKIYNDLVSEMSNFHKVERGTLSAILKRLKALMHHMDSIDFLQFSGISASFGSMLQHCHASGLKFPYVAGWSLENFARNRGTFESAVMEQVPSLGSKCFLVAALGEVKAAFTRSDGTRCEVSTPLRLEVQDATCAACHCFNLSKNLEINSMDLSIRSDEVVSVDTIVLPVPASVLDVMMKQRSIPIHPACIISIRSSQELVIFGPQQALKGAREMAQLIINAISDILTRIPCVVPVNGDTLSFGYRFSLGTELRVQDVMHPFDSNILILSDVYNFLGSDSGKPIPLSSIEIEIMKEIRLRSRGALLPLEVLLESRSVAKNSACDANEGASPHVASAKNSTSSLIAHCVFGSTSDARNAYRLLADELLDCIHLPVESCAPARQSENAFRVTFAVSNFEKCASDESDDVSGKSFSLDPIQFYGRKLFPVNMVCDNHSRWHDGQKIAKPLPKAVCCTHHVKRLNIAAVRFSKMKLGFFHHTGQIIERDIASEAPCGGEALQSVNVRPLQHWSCCNQPSCDSIPGHGFPSIACRAAVLIYEQSLTKFSKSPLPKKKMFSFCWERHYFSSEFEQLEALKHPLAQEFERNHALPSEKKTASVPPGIRDGTRVSRGGPTPRVARGGRIGGGPPGIRDAKPRHQYCLVFVDEASKRKAEERLFAARRVPFQFGPHLQHLTDLSAIHPVLRVTEFDFDRETHALRLTPSALCFSVQHDFYSVEGSAEFQRSHQIRTEIERAKSIVGQRHLNRILDRTALHGALKTRQCLGIVELSVVAEPLPEPDVVLPQLNELIVKERVLSIIQTAGKASSTLVIPDPVLSVSHGQVTTFRGLFGCQMVSFLVQASSPGDSKMLQDEFQKLALGRASKHHVSVRAKPRVSCIVECCSVSKDTSLSCILPLDASINFIENLERACISVRNQILCTAPDSIVSFIIGPKHQHSDTMNQKEAHEHSSASFMHLVFNCNCQAQRAIVDAALQPFLQGRFYFAGAQYSRWFSTLASDPSIPTFDKFLQRCRLQFGLCACLVSKETGCVQFRGSKDAIEQAIVLLNTEYLPKFEEAAVLTQRIIDVNPHQFNGWESLTFLSRLQLIVDNVSSELKLQVTATETGHDLLHAELLRLKPSIEETAALRYVDIASFESTDVLNDEWIVLLTCGHVHQKANLKYWLQLPNEDRLLKAAVCPHRTDQETCGKAISWQDLKTLLDGNDFDVRVKWEIDRFVSMNQDRWQLCPRGSSVCRMIYPVSSRNQQWSSQTCPACSYAYCGGCGRAPPHGFGMSCAEAGAVGDAADLVDKSQEVNFRNLFIWPCPMCKTLVLRDRDCPQMSCAICRHSFSIRDGSAR